MKQPDIIVIYKMSICTTMCYNILIISSPTKGWGIFKKEKMYTGRGDTAHTFLMMRTIGVGTPHNHCTVCSCTVKC